jgi:hypothetical protein
MIAWISPIERGLNISTGRTPSMGWAPLNSFTIFCDGVSLSARKLALPLFRPHRSPEAGGLLTKSVKDILIRFREPFVDLSHRIHSNPPDRVHGITTKGGDALNIIPAHTTARYFV